MGGEYRRDSGLFAAAEMQSKLSGDGNGGQGPATEFSGRGQAGRP